MSFVKVRPGEVEKALRLLKKKLDKEATLKTAKKKQYYEKPSNEKRIKSKLAAKYKKMAARSRSR